MLINCVPCCKKQVTQTANPRLKSRACAASLVKIGIAANVATRISGIVHASGLDVRRYHETALMPNNTAAEIERELHRYFGEYRTNGEFFNITFDAACEAIDRYAPAIDATNKNVDLELSTREKIQFLLECAKLSKGSDRARLVRKVERLIGGEDVDLFDDEPLLEKSVVERFIEEHCVEDPKGFIPRPTLNRLIRKAYPDETADISNQALSAELKQIENIRTKKIHGVVCVKGIRLVDEGSK